MVPFAWRTTVKAAFRMRGESAAVRRPPPGRASRSDGRAVPWSSFPPTSPSSVSATLVKIVLDWIVRHRRGGVGNPRSVPGATPKIPARVRGPEGFHPHGRSQAMSSPTMVPSSLARGKCAGGTRSRSSFFHKRWETRQRRKSCGHQATRTPQISMCSASSLPSRPIHWAIRQREAFLSHRQGVTARNRCHRTRCCVPRGKWTIYLFSLHGHARLAPRGERFAHGVQARHEFAAFGELVEHGHAPSAS